ELDIVRRVGVDEVVGFERNRGEVSRSKFPCGERLSIGVEVVRISDPVVPSERDVEIAAAVEAAQAGVRRAIQVVEKSRRLASVTLAGSEERVEPLAVRVEDDSMVREACVDRETALHPLIKVDEVRVDVVEERAGRRETQGDGEAPA